MKKELFLTTFCAGIIMTIGFTFGIWYSDISKVKPYREYYNATEALLDTLEKEYNWVDKYDAYEYYDAIVKIHRVK